MAYVGACKAAQGIWDIMLFTQLVSNIRFELLKKLRSLHKSQIVPYGQSSGYDQQLLKNVNYGRVICLNNYI